MNNNNLNLMRARLEVRGGEDQRDRMIQDKRTSLNKAILYSYQSAEVREFSSETIAQALINPNQVKQDYDDKIISIGYEYGYKPGTVFEWVNTGTVWLIYLQDLTELAYFKGDIRKCSFYINWRDHNGNIKTTYAAVRGPVESKIDSLSKGNYSMDTPNHSINLLLPKTEETLKHFSRYSEFYLSPLQEGDTPICWRVEATDTLSMPGILEITAVEYYSNEFEDDVEQGIVGGLVEEPIPQEGMINGETFIKPKMSYTYTYTGEENSSWSYDERLPIEAHRDGKSIVIKWTTTYNGQFVLKYGNEEKTIVVESLF